ncbi:MAG TPA: thiamine pyrophosphate-dependent enzyme [Anaeromyxobacter sp.]|nr:thiamine pyrophosphate-dependent enzyme [Anaeromyxobacter sp.]
MRREDEVDAARPPSEEPAGEAQGGILLDYPIRRIVDEEGTADPAEVAPSPDEVRVLYRWMLLSRALDERMVMAQRQGRIGFYVGAVGEEASVVGATAGLEEEDWIFPCYREHAAALMRGLPLPAFLCGLLGNAGDPLRGRQMPCHEAWRPGRIASISSPIGTHLTHAVGAAWAARLRGDDLVALAFLGDGATSAHDFHTAMNFAAVHRVPVIFACRNNGWAISVPYERQTASPTVAQKGVAYGMRAERVDGNDVLAVRAATREARARAVAGQGPTLLELVTYRMEAHSTSDDPRAYRSDELVEPWRRRDPLLRIRAYLGRRGALDEGADERLRTEIREEIRGALREAEAEPARPPLSSLFEDVYAEPLWQQREQRDEIEAAAGADPRVSDPHHADA